ncbi:DUF1465 family protein [Sphingobium sp. EM0848]|uniref:DUF1465 family protein n=1 Tax=Sphingobium sp. EM0848 TaxID=2743473 RepID=UPI00159BF80B|nr:DUF1465 family protein [Sphingobium sp. EM0848]
MYLAASLDQGLHRRLVDGLYVEAMVMADEARAYFDTRETSASDGDDGGWDDPLRRVAFACESLKVTTRLMHIIAWLLSQRAWQRGEIDDAEMWDEKYSLGHAAGTDPAMAATFPFAARALIDASQDLYERVARLQERMTSPRAQMEPSPARVLMERLSTAF